MARGMRHSPLESLKDESPLKTTNLNPPDSSWGDIFSQVTLRCKFLATDSFTSQHPSQGFLCSVATYGYPITPFLVQHCTQRHTLPKFIPIAVVSANICALNIPRTFSFPPSVRRLNSRIVASTFARSPRLSTGSF